MSEPESVKVVLLGESGVGKTSIINQFTTNKFDPDCVSSLSAQYISKIINYEDMGKTIKFEIWDTAGQEKFRSLAKIFYNNAKVIIFVYDITSSKTFSAIKEYWYEQIKLNSDSQAVLALVANKNDLYNNQQVPNSEGQEFADEIGAIFQSTTAMSESGINKLFDNIGHKYCNPAYDYKEEDKKAQENYLRKISQKQNQDSNQNQNQKTNENIKLKNQKDKKNSKGGGGCC